MKLTAAAGGDGGDLAREDWITTASAAAGGRRERGCDRRGWVTTAGRALARTNESRRPSRSGLDGGKYMRVTAAAPRPPGRVGGLGS